MKSLLIIIIILIIVGVSFSSKSSTSSSEKGKELGPIKIGAALMLTGPTALLGELQQRAIGMAIEKINKDGGINGRQLEVVVEDSAYDPKTAVSAYQALKLKGLRNFIIDGSSVVAATRKLVVDDGNFTIAPVATALNYYDGNNRTCRISITARTIGPRLSELVLKKGYKKVAVLLPDNEYGRGWAEEFTKSYPTQGGTIVVTEFYSAAPGMNDYRTSITKIKAKQDDIDGIVMSNVLNTVESMLKQMKEIGLTKPIISDFATLTNPALKDMSLVEGVDYVEYEYTKDDVATDSSDTRAFKMAYREKYNSSPIYFSAGHYDVTLLLAKAISVVGEDPQKIADYISGLKEYQGITGKYSFDSDCEVQRNTVFRHVKDGKSIEFK
jgi:branched-chain amino acid transport system substrate-binding protein